MRDKCEVLFVKLDVDFCSVNRMPALYIQGDPQKGMDVKESNIMSSYAYS
jgi:hypothetical protein